MDLILTYLSDDSSNSIDLNKKVDYSVTIKNNLLTENENFINSPVSTVQSFKNISSCNRPFKDITNESDHYNNENNSKKEKKDNRLSRKIKRNSGEEYVTEKGKKIPARTTRSLSECRNKCYQAISNEDRISIFNAYRQKKTFAEKVAYLNGLIELHNVQRRRSANISVSKKPRKFSTKYFLPVESRKIIVCKKCFLDTFGEKLRIVRTIIEKKFNSKGMPFEPDLRGKAIPSNKTPVTKIEEVLCHIRKFPAFVSHYSRRHTSVKYLCSGLTLAIMYRLYCKEIEIQGEKPVSLFIYRKVFKTTKLKFKPPQLDTCHKCDVLAAKIKYAISETDKKEAEIERDNHLQEAKDAYDKKSTDKKNSRDSSDKKIIVCSFDLQQCLPTPMLHSNVSFYKRPLWTYNLTINNMTEKKTQCCMWHEGIGNRGPCEIGSCLQQFINKLSNNIEHVIFYSDSCSGQNKNNYIAAMFLALIQNHPHIKIIDHKFLLPGHTHMECDSDHAVIERAKKIEGFSVQSPEDWYNIVRKVRGKNPFNVVTMDHKNFFDFEKLFKGDSPLVLRHKNCQKQKIKWQNIRWIRYKNDQHGKFLYKNSLQETENFQTANFIRKGKENTIIRDALTLRYKGPMPISNEKKKDLIDMIPLLDPSVHNFYTELKSDENMDEKVVCIDPDVEFIEKTDDSLENLENCKGKNSSKHVKKVKKSKITNEKKKIMLTKN